MIWATGYNFIQNEKKKTNKIFIYFRSFQIWYTLRHIFFVSLRFFFGLKFRWKCMKRFLFLRIDLPFRLNYSKNKLFCSIMFELSHKHTSIFHPRGCLIKAFYVWSFCSLSILSYFFSPVFFFLNVLNFFFIFLQKFNDAMFALN